MLNLTEQTRSLKRLQRSFPSSARPCRAESVSGAREGRKIPKRGEIPRTSPGAAVHALTNSPVRLSNQPAATAAAASEAASPRTGSLRLSFGTRASRSYFPFSLNRCTPYSPSLSAEPLILSLYGCTTQPGSYSIRTQRENQTREQRPVRQSICGTNPPASNSSASNELRTPARPARNGRPRLVPPTPTAL